MNEKLRKLWKYLRIKDEVLVVAIHNPQTGKNEFAVTEMVNGKLLVSILESFDPKTASKPVRIIKQRDSEGRFEIPDPDEMEYNRSVDY